MGNLSQVAKSFLAVCFTFICIASFVVAPDAQAAPPADFTELVKKAGPAVVNISTERTVQRSSRGGFFMPPNFPGGPDMDEFERFFEQFNQFGNRQPRKERSLGSGFIISEDGYVVTNYHVIKEADIIKVNFYNAKGKETSYAAQVVGADQETDLALLKIDADRSLSVLSFGDSENLEVGSWVLAIGNPFGLDHTVTSGILSAKWRKIGSGPFDDFLQTDASINPGNSGGPLLNMAGEVIGINTAIVPQGQGLGFAIPSSIAKDVIESLKTSKKVSRGWLGVNIQNVDEATAKALSLPEASGALIAGVLPGQPAAKAGIETGDVIQKVGDTVITSSDDLLRAVAALKPSSSTQITLWRDGKTHEVKVTLAERNADQAENNTEPAQKQNDNAPLARMGLAVRTLNPKDAATLKLELENGVLVTQVAPDSVAAENGIQEGDVIVAVTRTKVKNVEELSKLVAEADKGKGVVMLQLHRRGQQFIRTIEIPKTELKK